jgi:hypothetical protein
MAEAMENPILRTDIQENYKKFLSYEAGELTERLGVNSPVEFTYLTFEELVQEWNSMGISVTFDIDVIEI